MMDLDRLHDLVGCINPKDVDALKKAVETAKTVFLLGNGGSSAVCSHIAQDYSKMLNVTSWTFDNSSQLTCYMNDYGQEEAYHQWLSHQIQDPKESLVILISSSGNSNNILKAARWCEKKGISFIVLSGFDPDNNLRRAFKGTSILEYYVPSDDYGIVASLNQIFLHSII